MADKHGKHEKSHPVGTGTGTAGGGLAGMAVGGAVGGPVGAAVGAIVGGVAGAAAGHEIAERVNPDQYDAYWENNHRNTPYYSSDYGWGDYGPAYRYGYQSYASNGGRDYDSLEPEMASNWARARGDSRLEWNDARPAVRDGWDYVDRSMRDPSERRGGH